MEHVDIFKEFKKLREEIEQERRLRKQWQERCYALEKELKDVQAKLNIFLNSNTPSSKLPPRFKSTFNPRPEKGTIPRGKPENSNGATKDAPSKIDRTVAVSIEKNCSDCGKKLHINTFEKIVYDIPKITLTVTAFNVEEGFCSHCNILCQGTHPDLPKEGMIGNNLQTFIVDIKHNLAGSYDKISTFLKDLTGETFSPTAINDCIDRVAQKLQPQYHDLEQKLSESVYAHSDETSWPVDGKSYWLWLFITNNCTFITIKNSRSRRVVSDIFGENYNGVIISDAYKVYENFASAFQKDWCHLLRKIHFETQKYPKRNIIKLLKLLKEIYRELNEFISKEHTYEERFWQSIIYHQKLDQIKNFRWSNPAKQIIRDWIEKYRGQWLVPLLMPEVALTNNICERGIRKVIPTRKLLGGHRTEKGAKNFAIIETMRQTWKQQGISPHNALTEKLIELNITS